jgi:hypothetical protein
VLIAGSALLDPLSARYLIPAWHLAREQRSLAVHRSARAGALSAAGGSSADG